MIGPHPLDYAPALAPDLRLLHPCGWSRYFLDSLLGVFLIGDLELRLGFEALTGFVAGAFEGRAEGASCSFGSSSSLSSLFWNICLGTFYLASWAVWTAPASLPLLGGLCNRNLLGP